MLLAAAYLHDIARIEEDRDTTGTIDHDADILGAIGIGKMFIWGKQQQGAFLFPDPKNFKHMPKNLLKTKASTIRISSGN